MILKPNTEKRKAVAQAIFHHISHKGVNPYLSHDNAFSGIGGFGKPFFLRIYDGWNSNLVNVEVHFGGQHVKWKSVESNEEAIKFVEKFF